VPACVCCVGMCLHVCFVWEGVGVRLHACVVCLRVCAVLCVGVWEGVPAWVCARVSGSIGMCGSVGKRGCVPACVCVCVCVLCFLWKCGCACVCMLCVGVCLHVVWDSGCVACACVLCVGVPACFCVLFSVGMCGRVWLFVGECGCVPACLCVEVWLYATVCV
jgi:hypothetical protein